MNDEQFIDIAIEISKKAKYPYGAIVVKDGEIIGRSDDNILMETSMYSHAELEAIESASKNKNLYGDLKGTTMYVSCEPCMMCMGAILYEEISKIVYAATLQDSNDNYCQEMITDIDALAKYSNSKIEIVKAGANVIFERGLWSSKDRKSIRDYYKENGVECEIHYVCVDDETWKQNIEERNKKVLERNGCSNFYLDEGLMKKLESKWEEPTEDEYDVIYKVDRNKYSK